MLCQLTPPGPELSPGMLTPRVEAAGVFRKSGGCKLEAVTVLGEETSFPGDLRPVLGEWRFGVLATIHGLSPAVMSPAVMSPAPIFWVTKQRAGLPARAIIRLLCVKKQTLKTKGSRTLGGRWDVRGVKKKHWLRGILGISGFFLHHNLEG